MSDGIVVRPVAPGDVDLLCDIAAEAWVPVFECWRERLGEQVYSVAFPDWQRDKRTQVRNACQPDNPAVVLVAEYQGKVAGFITYYLNTQTRVGEIGNNAVRPDFQGRGIGRRMYEHVFDQMRQAGMRVVKVTTGLDEAHVPARRAYEKVGFERNLQFIEYYRLL